MMSCAKSDPDAQRWRAVDMMDEVVPTFPIETTPGPPPADPNNGIPVIPSTNSLNAAMILSEDILFFFSIPIGTNTVREWRLVLSHQFNCRLHACRLGNSL